MEGVKMDFLTFLEKYEKQDVSKVKAIVESNTKKEDAIITEAFSSTYPSKKEALFNLEKFFTSKKTAPKGVDVKFVNENMDRLKSKIQSLTEGDIRIIIHNHEGTKDKPSVDYTEEGAEIKKRRGRPAKPSVVYGVEDDSEVITDDALVGSGDAGDTSGDIESDTDDELIESLSQMGLTEKELKDATDMAQSGTIDETDDSKVAKAAKIISKINTAE
jgi:hypothetical protein